LNKVRKDGKGVLPVMSTNRLRDCSGRRSTQLLGAWVLDRGGPPDTLENGLADNQMGWANFTRKAYSTKI
jgi:hypothetical protein